MNKNFKKEKVKAKQKIENTNKGITLIALIITIIVLLILAVVAIRAVTGDGILAHARNARDKWLDATANEEAMLGNLTNYITEQSGNNPTGGGEENPSSTLKIELKVDEAKVTGTTIPVSVAKITANESEEKAVDDSFSYKWFINDASSDDDNPTFSHTFSDLNEEQSYKIKCLVTNNSTGDNGSAELTVLSFKVVDTLYRGTEGMTWNEWIKSGYVKSFPLNEEHYKQFLKDCGWDGQKDLFTNGTYWR